MEPNDFVHLHYHTEYSALDGINKVKTSPELVKSLGQTALAITDHGTVSGTYAFFNSCKKQNIKPILGMEAYYAITDKSAREKDEDGNKYYHLVLLAANNTGLKNLFAISSKAYTDGFYYAPRCDDALLAEHAEGLIATSACLGSRTSKLILSNRTQEAEKLLDLHHEMFKGKFLIEIQLHEDKDQQEVNRQLIKIASKRDWPLVLTNDCHYANEHDKFLHELTLCMSTNARMSYPPWNPETKGDGAGRTRFSFGDIDVHTASMEWMWERAQKQGIPYEAILNTKFVANYIQDDTYFIDKRNKFPYFKDLPEGFTSWEVLENMSKNLLAQKMNGIPPKEYRDRINYELKIIKKMGFYDYLLILHQILNKAKEEDILVGPGRGSAAGSLVAYALGITTIDPIKYNLLFERWLNYGRASTPLIFDQDMLKQIEQEKQNHSHSHSCSNQCKPNCSHH